MKFQRNRYSNLEFATLLNRTEKSIAYKFRTLNIRRNIDIIEKIKYRKRWKSVSMNYNF